MTTVNNTTVPNPNFSGLASFSSGGPRNGDSFLKPWITAPGVSIFSTGIGTGNLAGGNSGTSMASPHVAGVAAIVRQAHPGWFGDELTAAIVNTGNPAGIGGRPRTARAAQEPASCRRSRRRAHRSSRSRATGSRSRTSATSKVSTTTRQSRTIRLWNKGATPVTFSVGTSNAAARRTR